MLGGRKPNVFACEAQGACRPLAWRGSAGQTFARGGVAARSGGTARACLADRRPCRSRRAPKAQEPVDLYSFTSVLCRELDQEGRQRIVEMLWEIVLADGVLHEYEADLVSRGAELLGVSTRDRVRLRKIVENRTR